MGGLDVVMQNDTKNDTTALQFVIRLPASSESCGGKPEASCCYA